MLGWIGWLLWYVIVVVITCNCQREVTPDRSLTYIPEFLCGCLQ